MHKTASQQINDQTDVFYMVDGRCCRRPFFTALFITPSKTASKYVVKFIAPDSPLPYCCHNEKQCCRYVVYYFLHFLLRRHSMSRSQFNCHIHFFIISNSLSSLSLSLIPFKGENKTKNYKTFFPRLRWKCHIFCWSGTGLTKEQ